MIFNSPIVQKYILSGAKLVATIRKKGYYRAGQRVIIKMNNKRIYGKIITITPLSPFSLSKYVVYSGFENVEEWEKEAKRLHKAEIDPNKFEIVVVELIS
jgi:hypothetical protein